jgi:hypothetical protein
VISSIKILFCIKEFLSTILIKKNKALLFEEELCFFADEYY